MVRILLAEDDSMLRENISMMLSSEGYDVKAASNGMEALSFVEEFNPDLILSDIMMPVMDGIEMFSKIKNNPGLDAIPFIFLTAKVDLPAIRQGMNLGADDYITKPFKSRDLLSAIKIRLDKAISIKNRIHNLRNNISLYVPHELRTPLVSILGYSDILREELASFSSEEITEMLSAINRSGKRLLERIEKFILFSELMMNEDNLIADNPDNEFYLKDSDVKHNLKAYLSEEIDKKTLEINLSEALIKIPQRYFDFIIREIVQNALKFSLDKTVVRVEGSLTNDQYSLNIKDEGCGLTSEQIIGISAFQQFDRKKHQQVGNGLGLAIAKKMITLSGGKMNIESAPNIGTLVTVILPAGKIS